MTLQSNPTEGARHRAPSVALLVAALVGALFAVGVGACSTKHPGRASALSSVPVTAPAHTTTTTDVEPFAATATTSARRAVPESSDGALRFTGSNVESSADGHNEGRTQVTNTSGAYVNGVNLRWRLLGDDGHVIDSATADVGALAPGETRAVVFRGHAAYTNRWAKVEIRRAS